MITLSDVTVSYAHSTPLDSISAELRSPVNVVMGPSGSGKSTLLRVVAGLQKPDSGQVLVNGQTVAKPTWRSAGDYRIALVHQDYRLVEFLTVEENLRLPAELRSKLVTTEDIAAALDKVGLRQSFRERKPGSLSGGEQQRVAIARALLCEAEVLLADEPTGALDKTNTVMIAELLSDLGHHHDIRVMVATHDPVVASIDADRYYLADGALVRG